MHVSAGRDLETEVPRLHVHGVPHRGHEGRTAQLAHRQAKQQMVHGRVAADCNVGDIHRRGTDGLAKVVRQSVERGDAGGLQFRRAAGNQNGVIDAADEVGAPGGLRIFDAKACEPRARFQVDQESGGVGGAEIHGKAEQAAFQAAQSR